MNNEEQYDNDTPTTTPLMPPRITDAGQVVLLQVDGVGSEERTDSTTVIMKSFVVRIKDLPRILGEYNSMLTNIAEVSGASLSIAVDMRNILNNNVYVNVWGLREQVATAETMIFKLIREGYDDPPSFFPTAHDNIHHEVMGLPIDKVVRLLNKNSIDAIERVSSTWIDIDASKARKTGEAPKWDIHIRGANMKDIDSAIHLIITAEPGEAKKKASAGRSESFWNRFKSACNRMTKKDVGTNKVWVEDIGSVQKSGANLSGTGSILPAI